MLRVTEIFHSLQGESRSVGWPTVFVRLTGCPLRCHYCDTEYAFTGGQKLALNAILQQVESFSARHVTVTGGEPLAQKNCLPLLVDLADAGYHVSLETSGAMDVRGVDPRIVKVMDLKTPSSGEQGRNLWNNLAYLTPRDQIKFVIGDQADYAWAKAQLQQRNLTRRSEVLFSPVASDLSPKKLAGWILQDHLDVRFQLQLHKILWGDQPGR